MVDCLNHTSFFKICLNMLNVDRPELTCALCLILSAGTRIKQAI